MWWGVFILAKRMWKSDHPWFDWSPSEYTLKEQHEKYCEEKMNLFEVKDDEEEEKGYTPPYSSMEIKRPVLQRQLTNTFDDFPDLDDELSF